MALRLSVCVVTYNCTPQLLKLLESLEPDLAVAEHEVLVVDNASVDDPIPLLAGRRNVSGIRQSSNLFFTAADNINLARSKGDYILSINPDVEVRDHAISRMIDFLEKHRNVGAVAPTFRYPSGELQRSCGPQISFWSAVREIIYPRKGSYEQAPVLEGGVCPRGTVLYGACILIRRHVLNEVGLKDERLVHGWDEYDWCRRIEDLGYSLAVARNACVSHQRSATINSIREDSEKIGRLHRLSKDGYFYLLRKYYGVIPSMVVRLIWLLRAGFHRIFGG